MNRSVSLAILGLVAGLGCTSAALAQQSNTSGPAAGSNVQPSAAAQKSGPAGQSGATTNTAGGAAGAEAKPGTEAGPAQRPAPK